jgi:tyrosyl-tRNA synthetase
MLYEELKKRGLVFQETSPEVKQALEKPMTFYCGFDPTADSLHVGSLLPLITMRRLQNYGHKPIVLLGGATGMIGDPSFKSQERVLQTPEMVEQNIKGIRKNVERVIDFGGDQGAVIVNNMDWMSSYSYIDFLRDIGKFFSVNAMLSKDSVRARIEDREQGISYTEFSYTLLQAYDFHYLHQKLGCQLQVGASDQWGNITSGVELVRRLQGDRQDKDVVYGLTFPLITKADGTKFGKSESGNVWLNPDKTSPYQFYQFFINLPDSEVMKLMYYFSFKTLSEIQSIEESFKAEPHKREAQKVLAQEMTTLIHGPEEYEKARKASEALFSGNFSGVERATLQQAFSDVPSCELNSSDAPSTGLLDLLVQVGLCSSKGAARKDIKAGAVYIEGQKLSESHSEQSLAEIQQQLTLEDKLPAIEREAFWILRRGKKNYCLLRFN